MHIGEIREFFSDFKEYTVSEKQEEIGVHLGSHSGFLHNTHLLCIAEANFDRDRHAEKINK